MPIEGTWEIDSKTGSISLGTKIFLKLKKMGLMGKFILKDKDGSEERRCQPVEENYIHQRLNMNVHTHIYTAKTSLE